MVHHPASGNAIVNVTYPITLPNSVLTCSVTGQLGDSGFTSSNAITSYNASRSFLNQVNISYIQVQKNGLEYITILGY